MLVTVYSYSFDTISYHQNPCKKITTKKTLKREKIAKRASACAIKFWAKRTRACDVRAAESRVCECACVRGEKSSQLTVFGVFM